MNKRQKEILQNTLTAEERELKHLKAIYNKALSDINDHIARLKGREDADLQHVIYQIDYQRALKGQVSAILDELNSKQFESISQYMAECYEDGFVGAMYDIAGQGIPIITPIDQKQVLKAMKTDSKISGSLYTKLGEDVTVLKKRIANNISRGFATGQSYAEMARNIAADSNVGFNRAARIARTEGARVYNTAAYDAQHKAKEKGADIVKQWDASLDGNTRPSHRRVDGEIRELDEKFSNGLMHPSDPAGEASEVINCRCTLLQRATWALDEDELETLKERAAAHGLDKTDQFEDFKKKYLKAAENSTKTVATNVKKVYKESEKLDISNFSPAFTTKSEVKNTQKFVDYVNNLEGSHPDVLKLYTSIGKLDKFEANGIKFSISHGKNHAVQQAYNGITGKFAEVKLIIPKLSGDNLAGQVNTTLHEQMHLLDLLLKEDATRHGAFFAASNETFKAVFKATDDTIGEAVGKLFEDFKKEYDVIRNKYQALYKEAHAKILDQYMPNGAWAAGADYKGYKKATAKLKSDIEAARNYDSRNIMGSGINELQDIYDALSGGKYRDTGVVKYGHGSKYYRSTDSRIDETIANYAALSVTRPDLVEMLKEDKPELVKALEELVQEMGRKVDNLDK